ncbi:Ion transport protein-domain-containing protein [Mucor mucedo]|uniref:Ion transport protein-domain-containing protein n=1 Tax=Mucor mucedo TaxID=29922 RepID=UPI00221ECB7E|nr:Ion transport protein-domain-containing protein [Mucor mucedo]KAI7889601.1 Ion transport protein-domain-containing protein [Mucor mucedo]
MDLISILAYWTDVLLLIFLKRQPPSILQALASMRLLRFLVMTEGTAVIMKSLRWSYEMLKNVMGFFIFFLLLFSLVALFVFMNAFNRRCAIMPPTPLEKNMTGIQFVEPRISCSGYMLNTTRRGVYDIDLGQQYETTNTGLFCQQGQVCIQGTQNQPGYHHMSFQNIFYAMLNIMTVISTEDWTDLMYMTQESVSEWASSLFYCACIYLMTFMIVPLFIAVITTSFSRTRGDNLIQHSAFASKHVLLTVKKTSQQHQQHLKHDGEEWIYINPVQKLRGTHRHTLFMYLGSLLVLVHVICMTFYHAHLSERDTSRLDTVDQLFTWLFAVEIPIRIYYAGGTKFWKGTRNKVDTCIAVATVSDVLLGKHGNYHIYLLVFSVTRSYRIAYLFPGVVKLLVYVIGDGQGIRNLTFFTFLVISLLAPIAVQLLGGDFGFVKEDEPSMRFDNSYQAFLAIFQIMTGENWTDILYDSMHSQEHDSVTCAALFIVFIYFVVHYMVLNLFIAVIMENFDLDEEDIKQIQIKKYIREHRWKPEYFKMDSISRFLLPLFVLQDERKLHMKNLPPHLVSHVTASTFKKFLTVPQQYKSYSKKITPRLLQRRRSSSLSQFSIKSLVIDPIPYASTDYEEPHIKYGDEYEFNVARENKAVIINNLQLFRSMGILKNDNQVRKFCTNLKDSVSYNRFICTCICLSTLLALWADESNRLLHPVIISTLMEPIQTTLLIVYFLDVLVHMAADGVFMLPKSYLRNAWNLFDLMNLVSQVIFTVQTGYSSYLRILRTLRSIRIVYYIQGTRMIFLDLVHGLPKMMNAVTLNLLVFVPFAIYGCYLFSGKFALCNDENAGSIRDCEGEFQSSEEDNFNILLPRVWKNPYDYSFDTFGESLLHLFECASGEGWIMSLFSAMSVPNTLTDQPKFSWSSSSIFHSIFYIVFMFVASLCSIQLFIGVFLDIFKQRSGIFALTNTQRQFRDLQRQLALVKPSLKAIRPENPIRASFYDLVIQKRGPFARFMVAVKMFLVGIAFRLAQRCESLDTLFRSIRRAVPSIFYVSTVFAIVILCFGVTFQEHFSSTRYGPYGNEHANFRSLYTTILTLFRITTGENWDFLMHDFTILPPTCVGKDDCGAPTYAIVLFISFYVICTFIFVNLFTAIVIDNFSFTFDTRNRFSLITRADLRLFKVAWADIDPTASGYISIKDIPRFLSSLNGALAVRIYEKQYSLKSLLDASNQVDTDSSHLTIVPLPEYQQSCNMLTDRYFNLHALSQVLASIDPNTIQERKRQYTLIYQEIVNSASHRGVSFHDMLEILAIQLVDISKSLTFVELVNRARVQDKISKDLAAERARGLIAMLVQRRKFLKARQKPKLKRVKSSSSAIVISHWLTPTSDQKSETSHTSLSSSGKAHSLYKMRKENGNET